MERLQAWGAQLIAVFRDTLASLVTYLPVVLTAAAVLLIGWLLAHLIRSLVRRALESMDWLFARLMPRSAGRSETLDASHEPRDLDGRVLDRAADLRRERAAHPGRHAVRALDREPARVSAVGDRRRHHHRHRLHRRHARAPHSRAGVGRARRRPEQPARPARASRHRHQLRRHRHRPVRRQRQLPDSAHDGHGRGRVRRHRARVRARHARASRESHRRALRAQALRARRLRARSARSRGASSRSPTAACSSRPSRRRLGAGRSTSATSRS